METLYVVALEVSSFRRSFQEQILSENKSGQHGILSDDGGGGVVFQQKGPVSLGRRKYYTCEEEEGGKKTNLSSTLSNCIVECVDWHKQAPRRFCCLVVVRAA
jgi:hypothetical protein